MSASTIQWYMLLTFHRVRFICVDLLVNPPTTVPEMTMLGTTERRSLRRSSYNGIEKDITRFSLVLSIPGFSLTLTMQLISINPYLWPLVIVRWDFIHSSSPHSPDFIRGQYHSCQQEYFLAIHKKGWATPPVMTLNLSSMFLFGCVFFMLAHTPFVRIRKSIILYCSLGSLLAAPMTHSILGPKRQD